MSNEEYIEFELWDTPLRYYPKTGEFERYSSGKGNFRNGNKKKFQWRTINFWKKKRGVDTYYCCCLKNEDKEYRNFHRHRMVYYLYNPEWDIHDTTRLIDHIHYTEAGDGIENLRSVSYQGNKFNTRCKGYTRVVRSDGRVQFRACIMTNRKNNHLGYYDTTEEARMAYLNAKPIYHKIE